MRHIIFVVVGLSLALAACKKEEAAPAPSTNPAAAPSEKPAGTEAAVAAPKGPDYSKIDGLVTAAKTGDEYTAILMECGKLEIEAASNGNGELSKDNDYREHCRWNVTKTRTELAIAESKPDAMSVHCLSASMQIDELVTDGIHADEAKALGEKLKTACGM